MKQITTYTTLIKDLPAPTHEALQAYSALFCRVERHLYADIVRSTQNQNQLKQRYIRQFGISARQFNAVWRSLQGKLDSKRELYPLYIEQRNEQIESVTKTIQKFENRFNSTPASNRHYRQTLLFKIHQKQRRKALLEHRLAQLEYEQTLPVPPMCFGSKKLFNAQHHLEANGFENHGEWRETWQSSRSSGFYVLGSKDETWGNQGAQLIPQPDGRFALHLRLPDSLGGGSQCLENIDFKYGKDVIHRACLENQTRQLMGSKANLSLLAAAALEKDPVSKTSKNSLLAHLGQAVTVRFNRHKFGWQLAVTVDEPAPEGEWIDFSRGCLGVDVNADHLALCVVTPDGNKRHIANVACPISGKMDSGQRSAAVGDAIKQVFEVAKEYGVAIAYENLDFKKKKARLKESAPIAHREMLSSFAYNLVLSYLQRRALRERVKVCAVRAACTSIIGRLKYQSGEMSVHQAASLVIARRGLGFVKERIRFNVPAYVGAKVMNARPSAVSMAVAPFSRWLKANKVVGNFKKGAVLPEKLCSLKVHDGTLSLVT